MHTNFHINRQLVHIWHEYPYFNHVKETHALKRTLKIKSCVTSRLSAYRKPRTIFNTVCIQVIDFTITASGRILPHGGKKHRYRNSDVCPTLLMSTMNQRRHETLKNYVTGGHNSKSEKKTTDGKLRLDQYSGFETQSPFNVSGRHES
jgi:hypothetical protein